MCHLKSFETVAISGAAWIVDSKFSIRFENLKGIGFKSSTERGWGAREQGGKTFIIVWSSITIVHSNYFIFRRACWPFHRTRLRGRLFIGKKKIMEKNRHILILKVNRSYNLKAGQVLYFRGRIPFMIFIDMGPEKSWKKTWKLEIVFCYRNCSDLLIEKKNVPVIEKKLLKFDAEGREFAKF